MLRRIALALSIFIVAFTVTHAADASATVKQVMERGYIKCGVNQGLAGFSAPDDKGDWSGIDVDFCRAVSAAIFGDDAKVKYIPLSAKERFTALQSGEIDILSRNTTWTMSRDTSLGLKFAGVIFYDGQGFMVRKSSGVESALELDGAIVCTNAGTTTELNVADYFRSNNMKYEILTFDKPDETVAAYQAGRCDVISADASGLAAEKLKLANSDEHFILPEVISKEPLGPAVRQGDDNWGDIVRWTLFVMLNAEELGINSGNAEKLKSSPNPEIQRLLGTQGDFGEKLGLDNKWAYNVVTKVGNYGEIYDRNLGKASRLNIPRKLNSLWKNGGLHYAPPVR